MILSKMSLSITTLNKMELTIMTISMMTLSTTKSALWHAAQQHSTLQISAWQHSLKLTTLCHTALWQLSSKLKGSSLLKSVYALSFAFKPNILSVINVKVVMLNVVAPSYQVKECLGAQQHSTLQLSAWRHSLKLTTLCHTALCQLASQLKGSSLLNTVYALPFVFKPTILSVIEVKVVTVNVVAPSYQVKECLGVNIGTLG
jgi:hypothetical protein